MGLLNYEVFLFVFLFLDKVSLPRVGSLKLKVSSDTLALASQVCHHIQLYIVKLPLPGISRFIVSG